jgi:hypothetical protein
MPRGEHNKLSKLLPPPETTLEPATKQPNRGDTGRPTLYKPEYCQAVIDHCSQGYSFESFGGVIRVCLDTLNAWAKQYPEFLQAKKDAKLACLAWWERTGHQGMINNKDFGSAMWVFSMKARFGHMGWTDKHEVTHGLTKDVDDNGDTMDSSQLHEFLKDFSRGKKQ